MLSRELYTAAVYNLVRCWNSR